MGGGGGAGGRGGGGMGGGGTGGDMGGGGGGGGGMAMPTVRATIRWESAAPMMTATKRELPPQFTDTYLVSVSGLPVMGRRNPEGGGPNKAMLNRLKEGTQLQRKGKDPMAPDDVLASEDGMRVVFMFKKGSQPIEAGDKEVVFVTKLGAAALKAKFTLKDMMYQGKLAL